ADLTAATAAPEVIADSLGEYVKIWWTRVRSGESGALPVILGLVAIVIYFQVRSSLFLSAGNLVNLIAQAAWIVTLGMAEVFVLLLGEIELSIGYTSVIRSVFTCWLLLLPHAAPCPLAVLGRLDRDGGRRRAGRRPARHQGRPPPGGRAGRAPGQRDLAQGGRDGRRGRGRRADRQQQPRHRSGRGGGRALGHAGRPGRAHRL